MKIALIGEFSGVHAGLKKGLEELGHHVDIYSNGDGFKKIQSNKILNPIYDNLTSKIYFYLIGLAKILKFISRNYDIIQLANPHVISSLRGNSLYYARLIKILGKTNAIKSLAAVGCEANIQPRMSTLSRSPCPGCLKDYGLSVCPYTSKGYPKIMRIAEKFTDHIIPLGGPSYAGSYQHNTKYREILPFAVDISFIPHRINSLGGKIKIVHGLNRVGFKGSDVILEALKRTELDHPDSFEIIIANKLPFSDYIKLLSTTNVVVDQLYGDGLGMNALYSMGASCIVFSCFERVKVGNLDLTEAPAIQIGETTDEIYQQIVKLKEWDNKKFIEEGLKSREFVIKQNSPVKIAEQMLGYWASIHATSGTSVKLK